MRRTAFCPMLAACLSLAMISLLAACDNSIDPFVASDSEPFAIYGFLDSEADTQFVRISPVIDASGFVYRDTLDAEVFLHDLTAGTSVQMIDSSAILEDNRRAYFYYTEFPIRAGADYRLDVSGSGGKTTSALASMPGADQVMVQDPRAASGNAIVQEIRWEGVSSVRDIEIRYVLRIGSTVRTISLPYAAPRFDQPDVTTIDLRRDRDRVFGQLSPDTSGVRLVSVGASAEMLSPEWELGYQPGQVFFGSIGRVEKEWTLPDSVVTRLGYLVPAS